MSESKRITPPLSDEEIMKLKIGDRVLISGRILTGRDSAHKQLYDLIQAGKSLPVDIKGQIIYYVGPAPARPAGSSVLQDRQRPTAWIPTHRYSWRMD